MVKRKTIWIAELGKRTEDFPTKKEAIEKEREYNLSLKISKLASIFEKYFKTHYDEKDQYSIYFSSCVDCGKKLIEYTEEIFIKHEAEEKIKKTINKYIRLFGGFRCEKCNKKAAELFNKMILFFIKKNNHIKLKINIDIRQWKEINYWAKNKTAVLSLFQIVEFWDKNKE